MHKLLAAVGDFAYSLYHLLYRRSGGTVGTFYTIIYHYLYSWPL